MNPILRGLLIIVGIVLLIYGLYFFRSILTYLLIAVVLNFVGTPLVRLIRKVHIKTWRPPTWLASLLTLSAFVCFFYLLVRLFAPLVADQADLISSIDVAQAERNLELALDANGDWLNDDSFSQDGRNNRQEIIHQVQKVVNFSSLPNLFDNVVGTLGNLLVALFSILFMTFFFLKDGYLIERIIFTITPDKHMDRVKHILVDTDRLLSRYFIGVLVQITIITTIVSTGLAIVGIENALIIGLLAGFLNLIPYVGPIISTSIGLLLAATSYLGGGSGDMSIWSLLGLVLIVYLIAQAADNFFIQPYVLGNSVGAHPLEIFIVISMAGTLAGVTGMLVAIPAYTVLRIIAREFLSKFKVVESLTRGI